MLAYQKRDLSDMSDVGEPGNLPADLLGLADISLADLAWTDPALEYIGFGYFPVDMPDPPRPLAALLAQVNADRDAQIESGFLFEGHVFQTRATDRENITRKGDRAEKVILAALLSDPMPNLHGNLFWDVTTGDKPFAFKAIDNTWLPMDAFKMVEMRDAGESFKQTCTFIADVVKSAMIADGTDAGAQAIYDSIAWPE